MQLQSKVETLYFITHTPLFYNGLQDYLYHQTLRPRRSLVNNRLPPLSAPFRFITNKQQDGGRRESTGCCREHKQETVIFSFTEQYFLLAV